MNRLNAIPVALIAGTVSIGTPAMADEGMWTFDHPPLHKLEAKHGFRVTPEWLEHLQLSALNVGGASGSFVSERGLVLTNHHVALSCLQKLSTESRDLVRDGYLARSQQQELPCPGYELRRLESMQDVTAVVQASMHATDPAAANAERNAAIASIENACTAAMKLRCEVDTRYRGAAYELLRYKAWTDVRLVFAPEASVGFFGGDPDNFVYPRFDLDAALLRVYEDGKPVQPAHFLRWSKNGIADGDLVFAAGHPYSTDRLVTLAQLEEERDIAFPLRIASARRQRKLLQAFSERSPESARRAGDYLFGTENWLKAMLGEYRSLRDVTLFNTKRDDEAALRKTWVGKDDPWARIASATRKRAALAKESWSVGFGYRTLFDTAGTIVELAHERALSDGERLSRYRESAIPRILTRLTADVPVYKDLETTRIADSWDEARELLGDDHPFVREVLAGKSAAAAASALVQATTLDRLDVRRKLIDGGLAAVNASDDPFIALARRVYPMRRKLEKYAEIEIDEPIREASDEIARLRFKAFGNEAYPDATGSLRLSYGVVRGYDADGLLMPSRTNFLGLFARYAAFDGKPPFHLPTRWLQRERTVALATPLDFVSTVDIIGGNSGSPVVDRKGDLVGLIFDGNLESLGGRFGYTEDKARAIAVDVRAIIEALTNVYDAREVLREISGE